MARIRGYDMKRLMILLLFWAASSGPVLAQIELEWSLANDRTLLMEPIKATLTIANYTGKSLSLGPHGNARLRFDVEDQPTSLVRETGHPLVARPIVIPAGDTREIEVNLLDAYRIVRGQTYMLCPLLEVDGTRFIGRRLALEVQPGLEVLNRRYGMPDSRDGRVISLRQMNRRRMDRLFFRLDSTADGFCLACYDLGRLIRFFVPRLERDRDGVFHVLHQSAPDRFTLSRLDHEGTPLGVAFYIAEVGQIRLERDPEGAVHVVGGTPFEEDPERPGVLSAPSLPPANPYTPTIGELPPKRPAPTQSPARGRAAPRATTPATPAQEPISW